MFMEVFTNEYVILAYIIGYIGMFIYGRGIVPKYVFGDGALIFVLRHLIISMIAVVWPILVCYWTFSVLHDYKG